MPERVSAGRAIGWLSISSVEIVRNSKLVHFHPSPEDMALFREGDKVRMSQNEPDGSDFIEAMFLGLTDKGLSVTVPIETDHLTGDGWSLDETMIDLSDFYLKALDELATSAHGREVVLPALLDGAGDEVDFDGHGDFTEDLEDSGLDESQIDGVAMCSKHWPPLSCQSRDSSICGAPLLRSPWCRMPSSPARPWLAARRRLCPRVFWISIRNGA